MSDNNETLYKLAAQVADKTLDALEKFSGRECRAICGMCQQKRKP